MSDFAVSSPYPVIVDYNRSLADMVAVGRYDNVNPHITPERFPLPATGTVECDLVLVNFDFGTSSETATQRIAQMSLEPAKIEHLLAFGATYSDQQRRFPIAALGSSCVGPDNYHHAPYLFGCSTARNLLLYRCAGNLLPHGTTDKWDSTFHFLAVKIARDQPIP